MNVILGIGNELRGDDGAGSLIARRFKAKGWKAIDCGVVPENYTSAVKKARPSLLVIVDAADMGLAPGEIRRLPLQAISRLALSTHSMPLSLLIEHLQPHCKEIAMLGIQPKIVEDFAGISAEVEKAAAAVEKSLATGAISSFAVLA